MSDTSEFNMEFVDEKTIKVDGVMRGYEVPAEITIVNENKLRLRFVDDSYNDGDYAYSGITAHPFQKNGAPFRLKLSKAQLVN